MCVEDREMYDTVLGSQIANLLRKYGHILTLPSFVFTQLIQNGDKCSVNLFAHTPLKDSSELYA
jgi:hypothetical protein